MDIGHHYLISTQDLYMLTPQQEELHKLFM